MAAAANAGSNSHPPPVGSTLPGPVGSGTSAFDRQIRTCFENYTLHEDGRMYTFRWRDPTDDSRGQDPADSVARTATNQDLLATVAGVQTEEITRHEPTTKKYSRDSSETFEPNNETNRDGIGRDRTVDGDRG